MTTKLVNFYLDVEEGVDREAIAQILEEQLSELEPVNEVSAKPTETRLTGVEVVAGIALTVSIVKGTKELVDALNELMPEIKKFIQEVKGLKAASVEVGFEQVPVEKVDDAIIRELADQGIGE